MSTVFTGESKVFQFMAVDANAKSKVVPKIAINVPIMEKMIDDSVELARIVVQNPNNVGLVGKKAMELYDDVDVFTNNFIAEMEKQHVPWAEAYAAWVAYNEHCQAYGHAEAIKRSAARDL